ncbi:MAG: TRAP transporter large permease [Desulfofustis sp. PB-SRB1]|jgi:tripartite ATP-independent transporter DctM subunit|nr:TRAP transporter large permease [Desulfofustis sp. PB-SRB1]MBM1002810.1 TRAP transporter large permease [Desulfofustis sp. PB-SRB1]HBH29509.1 TRAP transporter large permease [Desulfofustis sp.]HBH30302.1 TRAP transporter large permease [Desulfofustis sp.]
MELVVLFSTFTLLLLLGVPIAVTLGASAMVTVVYMDIPPMVVFQRMASGMNVFSLMAIPFFIYAGELMQHGGISVRLVRLANAMIGHIRGGLGLVNVLSSMLFGGISGSAVADVSALGSTLIPMMKEKGYDSDYAVNVTVTSATIGLIVPPSHNMIIYSIAAGGTVSVSTLFMAGFLPGILTGVSLMIATYLVALKRGYPRETFPGFKMLLLFFANALPGLFTAVIIVGGVLSGIFTATESAAIAVIYALLVTGLFYRSMKWENFIAATLGAVKTTAMVLLIIGTAASFAWLLALNQVPDRLFDILQAISDNPYVIMLMVNIILLFLGTFMDMSPLIIICTPIFLPVMVQLGMDPVQFGIVLMINLGIGLVTPPVGSVLFVGCAVGKITMEQTARTIWPFYLVMVITLLLVTYIPAISMLVPNLFSG